MHFNKFLKISSLVIIFTSLVGCTDSHHYNEDTKEDYLIGNKVETLSVSINSDGSSRKFISLFDQTIRKIHIFDLVNNLYSRKISVTNPEVKHYLFSPDNGNYIIDLSSKSFTIHHQDGSKSLNPISMIGLPQSVAFSEQFGYFIILDENRTISILKLSLDGFVLSQWQGGSVVTNNSSIATGDLLPDGNLALILSDNTLVIIDVEQTLNNKTWVLKNSELPISLGINSVPLWMSAVRQNSDLIFLRSKDQLALISRSQKTVITKDINDMIVEKYSKSLDPHLILRSKSISHSDYRNIQLAFINNGAIEIKTLFAHPNKIVNSQLDLSNDHWSFVDINMIENIDPDKDLDEYQKSRNFRRYKISKDFMTIINKKIPDATQVSLGYDYLFTLFPSKIGYATRYNIQDEKIIEFKLFNLSDLGQSK